MSIRRPPCGNLGKLNYGGGKIRSLRILEKIREDLLKEERRGFTRRFPIGVSRKKLL